MPLKQASRKRFLAVMRNPAWICLIWFGMTAGVSLLATPVRFTAPTITRPIALDDQIREASDTRRDNKDKNPVHVSSGAKDMHDQPELEQIYQSAKGHYPSTCRRLPALVSVTDICIERKPR